MHSCTHWLRPRNSPLPPHLGSYTRALLLSQNRRHLFVTPCPGPFVSSKTNPITHPAQPHTHLHTLSYRPQVCHGGRIDRYSHSKNNEYTLAQGPPHVPYLGGRQGAPPVIYLVGQQAHVLYHKAHGRTHVSYDKAQAHLIFSSTMFRGDSTRLRVDLSSSSTRLRNLHFIPHIFFQTAYIQESPPICCQAQEPH